jgi:hypothetical protein
MIHRLAIRVFLLCASFSLVVLPTLAQEGQEGNGGKTANGYNIIKTHGPDGALFWYIESCRGAWDPCLEAAYEWCDGPYKILNPNEEVVAGRIFTMRFVCTKPGKSAYGSKQQP